jgi:DNA-binding NarL/FixJ family response regulator
MLEDAGMSVVGEAADGAAAVEAALRETPDLCLLDVSMRYDGIATARTITQQLPATKVIMLTVSASEEHVLAAARAGAVGYLLKEGDGSRLSSAVRAVAAGETSFPRRLMRRLVEELREPADGAERLAI